MITVELATRLKDAGLVWRPVSGDRFAVPDRDLDGEVFVVSDMTIETVELPTGPLVRFNGTTEWALDSIAQGEVIWLPSESQLRGLLGPAFRRLESLADGFAVEASYDDAVERFVDLDAERAYARAVLELLTRLAA